MAEIRAMTQADWPRVAEIYQQAIDLGSCTFLALCPDYEQFDRAHRPDCRLVIEQDGEIAGWAAVSQAFSRPAYTGVWELSIYLDENFRGQGLGTQLLEALKRETEAAGCWCLHSMAFSINKASVSLHKKCGFRVVGYREKIARDRFGNWQDTTVFEWRNSIR